MAKLLVFFLAASEAALALYAIHELYHCGISIVNLRGYEPTAKKAAEWSSKAQGHLYQTRFTQGVMVLAIFLTFLSCIHILFSGCTRLTSHVLALSNPFILLAARWIVLSYWSGSARIPVPGMADYNEAARLTLDIVQSMQRMMVAWVVIGVSRWLT